MDQEVTVRDAMGEERLEQLACEEPLQITLDGCPVSVVMRTPGHDDELVCGFLHTEAIIRDATVIRKIDLSSTNNHALVFLQEDHDVDLSRLRRNLFSASSCGICGKANIDAVMGEHEALTAPRRFSQDVLLGAPERLRLAQHGFESTGGLHAAGLFDEAGTPLVVMEDVGRHNAVDKVVGWGLRHGLCFSNCFLLVSGRVSFEIMQKALAARIPTVAAISAPSSLAVEFAKQSGQTLVAFLRPPKFNVYSGELA